MVAREEIVCLRVAPPATARPVRSVPHNFAHLHVLVDANNGGKAVVSFRAESVRNFPRAPSFVGAADKSPGLCLDGGHAVGDFARLQARRAQGSSKLSAAGRRARPGQLDDILAGDDLSVGGQDEHSDRRRYEEGGDGVHSGWCAAIAGT